MYPNGTVNMLPTGIAPCVGGTYEYMYLQGSTQPLFTVTTLPGLQPRALGLGPHLQPQHPPRPQVEVQHRVVLAARVPH